MSVMGKILAIAWPIAVIVFIYEQKSGGKLGIGVTGIVLLLLVTLVYFVIRLFRKRPSNKNIDNYMPKDAWQIAYKNFIQFFYFWVFIFVVLFIMYFMKEESISKFTFLNYMEFFLYGIFWFSIAMLFKQGNKMAIYFGYISISILFIFNIFSGFNIILILLYGYLLYLIYKASKTSTFIKSNIK